MAGKIKFTYQISRTANLLHFISNLTDWHRSVRPHYKRIWLEKTGELTPEETKILNKATKLFQKHGFGNGYWGLVFLDTPEEAIWEKAKQSFPDDYADFKTISTFFTKRFDLIWKEDLHKLKQWGELLESTAKYIPQDKIINDLNIFFPDKLEKDVEIKINLFLNPATEGSSPGGANTSQYSIEMEISNTPHKEVKHVWAVAWHELIHKIWQRDQFKDINREYSIENKIKSPLNGIPEGNLTKEMITEAFAPYGYIRQALMESQGIDSLIENRVKRMKQHNQTNMLHLRYLSSLELTDIAKNYVEAGKEIDQDFYHQVKKVLGKILA